MHLTSLPSYKRYLLSSATRTIRSMVDAALEMLQSSISTRLLEQPVTSVSATRSARSAVKDAELGLV